MRCVLLSVLTLGTLVSGCADMPDALSGRYGPAPVPSAVGVQAATQRQLEVVMAMAGVARPEMLPPPGARVPWYHVIQTGFNVVDDACMTYIDDLWILERRKNRNSAVIAAAGAATAGIIAATSNPSASTLAILAQAFGFASVLNAAISDSYLYTQNAATIKKLVRKTAEAYRTDLARKMEPPETEITYPIGSYAAAYHHMREYLALCLPPTIQAQIEDLVANAKAVPENSESDLRLTRAKEQAAASGSAPAVVLSSPTGGGRLRATTSIKVQ
jgi:hypothetical protein